MPTGSSNQPQVWAVAGGGPSRAGLFPGPLRIATRAVRRLTAHGAVQASAVFNADNHVFIADMAGWIQAFANTGLPLWQQQLAGAVSATPAVDVNAGRVFVGTHMGWVYALATGDGSVLWRRRVPTKTDARIVSDLLLLATQQWVVLSSWGGRFNALDAATGEIAHTWDAGISPQAGASADTSGNCFCLRAVRGEGVAFVRLAPDGGETVLHRQPEGERGASRMVVAAAPVLDERRGIAYFIVNRGRDSALHAWSLPDARLLWQREYPRMTVATPALRPDGALVLAGMDGAVHALAPEGSPLFRYETGTDYLLAGPVCDGLGNTFVGDPLGRLHVIDRGGSGRATFETTRSLQARPAFDRHGDLYLSGMDRMVHVFRSLAAA